MGDAVTVYHAAAPHSATQLSPKVNNHVFYLLHYQMKSHCLQCFLASLLLSTTHGLFSKPSFPGVTTFGLVLLVFVRLNLPFILLLSILLYHFSAIFLFAVSST